MTVDIFPINWSSLIVNIEIILGHYPPFKRLERFFFSEIVQLSSLRGRFPFLSRHFERRTVVYFFLFMNQRINESMNDRWVDMSVDPIVFLSDAIKPFNHLNHRTPRDADMPFSSPLFIVHDIMNYEKMEINSRRKFVSSLREDKTDSITWISESSQRSASHDPANW